MPHDFSARLPKFDDETLRTFACVAQLRSFSAAAEALNKTTSTISYRIKALEDALDAPLFLRTTRSVQLTPAGEVMLDRVKQIFDWLAFLPEEIQQVHDGVEPQFILAINIILYDAQATANLLAHLAEKFPRTVFRVHRAVYMGVWEELLHNGGHFGIGVPGFHTINDDFMTQPIGIVNWVFVIAPEHPLTRLPEPLSNHDLRPHPAINVEDTAQRISKRTAWLLPGQKEFLVPDFQTKLACHMGGLGVGFLPRPLARSFLSRKLLVERVVQVGRSPSPLSLAWRCKGAGRISEYLRALYQEKHELFRPFLTQLDHLR